MNCPNCFGNGYIRTRRTFSPATVSDCEECPECNGSGDVAGCVVCEDALPADDSDRCARCSDMSACENPPTTDPADAIPFDGEPFAIDGDDGFDPYTGGPEDEGFDSGCDDYYGDE